MSLLASTMFSAWRMPKKALPVELFRCYLQSAMKATSDLGLLQAGAQALQAKVPDQQDRFQKNSGQNIFRVRASGKPGRAACAAEETGGMCPARRLV
jgi:hypothetical protein